MQPAPAMSLEWSATAGRERRESRQHSMARVGKRRRKRHRPSASSAAASPQTSSSGDRINTEPHRRESLRKRIAVSRRLYSRQALAVSTLCALAIVSYIPAISGGFVWDDVIFTEEPIIREASGLWRIWFSPSDIDREGHYWPIVYTSFWLDHKLWDLAPIGCHAVNVLLHLVNCLLLWRLMLRLAVPGAWFIAAVFAVHPLHVESVAWVIERKDLLSALFYLSAALTWIRFTATPRLPTYLLALALFVAGLLSKSIVVTLPVALLIWHWWKRGRVTSADLLRLLPLFVIALCITAADLAFYRGKDPLTFDLSLIERVLIAARALWFYAGKLVWPVDLPVIYPRWEMDASDPLAWGYLAAAVALGALLWFVRKWVGTAPLVGASYFALTLSPVLGFVDFSYMEFSFVADRYQYLAGIGLTAALVGAAALQASKLQGKSRMVAQGHRGGRPHSSRSKDLDAGRDLQGPSHFLQPRCRSQSASEGRLLQSRQRAAEGGAPGRQPCRQPNRRGAAPGFSEGIFQPQRRSPKTGTAGRGPGAPSPRPRARPGREERPSQHGRAAQKAGAIRGGDPVVQGGARN